MCPYECLITYDNLLFQGILIALEDLEDGAEGIKKELLDGVVDLINKLFISGEGLFTTRSVYDLLWGYEDTLLKDIKKIQDGLNKLPGVHFDFVDQTTFGFGVCVSISILCLSLSY